MAAAVTVIVNAGKLTAAALPSVTLIEIPEKVPACPAAGVPDSPPVAVENVAHAGLLLMLNERESESASDAVGVKLYALPAATEVAGVPEIAGAELAGVVGVVGVDGVLGVLGVLGVAGVSLPVAWPVGFDLPKSHPLSMTATADTASADA